MHITVPAWVGRVAGEGVERLDAVLGGPARRTVIVVLTCVLGLSVADQGALSATAVTIQEHFGISKTQFGVLGSITTGASAVATLPFGMMVDRVTRTRLLGWMILLWGAAMAASGFATSYVFLLGSRVLLGVVVAVAYPSVASLVGDYFPVPERGRIYGYVLSGELLGVGVGVLLATAAASLFGSWRAAMFVLVLPALGVAWLALRLPEPARGGASRMPSGQQHVLSAERVERGEGPDEPAEDEGSRSEEQELVQDEVDRRGIEPDESLVLHRDPTTMGLAAAIRAILRVRTNSIVIVASGLGYFFFSGVRLFGIQFVEQHYGISRGTAASLLLVIGVAAVVGVLVGGRVADRLLRGGRISARVLVPAVTFLVAGVLFVPGLITTSVAFAMAFFLPAAFFFAASNPPLDAARLDLIVSRLWGRAEAVRSAFRGALEALAPVTFGLVSGTAFAAGGASLTRTFLVMLVPLFIASGLLAFAMRTYPRDVATTRESEREVVEHR